MAVVGFFHHIGTFLLLLAVALLIVTDVSAPVVHDIALLKVDLRNATGNAHTYVSFGTFGWCLNHARDGHDYCSKSEVGYNPAEIMSRLDGTRFSTASIDTTKALTKVMILHPISTGICFIAFMLTLGAGVVGSFLASLVALLSFCVTVVVLITDFVLWSIVKSNVNNDDSGSNAGYSTALWTLLVAAICTLIATVVVFFTCCSARMHRQRTTGKVDGGYVAPTRRRRFWQR